VICLLGLLAPALASLASQAAPVESSKYTMTYADLHGEVVLDNERSRPEVRDQPDSRPGRGRAPSISFWCSSGAGTQVGHGRSIVWKDGRVQWRSAADRSDAGR